MRGGHLLLMVMCMLTLVRCGVVSDTPGPERAHQPPHLDRGSIAPAGFSLESWRHTIGSLAGSLVVFLLPIYPLWAQHDIAAAASATAALGTIIETSTNGPG